MLSQQKCYRQRSGRLVKSMFRFVHLWHTLQHVEVRTCRDQNPQAEACAT
jgi:hypothetical protein